VALGTVADIVPLLGENRILVKYGLEVANEMRRPGLKALVEAAGLVHKTIEAGHIAFILAPRLNAAGRMGEAWPGVKLLTTRDEATAVQIAEELNEQ
jgi:single-stranded-DNA-specific exonuclease